ncbi:MAG TPA: SHOCT domain-containing protein [Acidimicrobiales bacterium]
MMMRRSPLLRVAAIGGVAYMGSKAGANKANQQQAAAAQQAAPAPAAAPQPQAESTDDKFAQLKELAGLHDSGVLTDEEFAAEKAKILG